MLIILGQAQLRHDDVKCLHCHPFLVASKMIHLLSDHANSFQCAFCVVHCFVTCICLQVMWIRCDCLIAMILPQSCRFRAPLWGLKELQCFLPVCLFLTFSFTPFFTTNILCGCVCFCVRSQRMGTDILFITPTDILVELHIS